MGLLIITSDIKPHMYMVFIFISSDYNSHKIKRFE